LNQNVKNRETEIEVPEKSKYFNLIKLGNSITIIT